MRRSKWRLAAVIWLCLLCPALLCGCKSRATAFTVNGLGVEKEELIQYMRDNMAVIAAELEETWGLDSTREDFWTAPQNGIEPFAALKEEAMRQIVRIKVEQLCAREQGIETPLYYSGQLRQLEEQNRRRAEAEANGEVLYGPVERNYSAYFREWYLEMQQKLREKWREAGVLTVSLDEMEAFYEENASTLTGSKEENMSWIGAHLLEEAYTRHIDTLVEQAEIGEGTAQVLPEEVI